MIERIPDWSWELTDLGVLLAPPDRALGVIFYAERVRPLRTIEAIVEGVARLFPPATPLQLTSTEALVTDEGEHAVIATLADNHGIVRTVGVVFGDDFYALCVGLPSSVTGSEMFCRQTRACVARDAHLLGVRRRRFVYEPPVGWQGLLSGPFHAAWYPLDYPNNPTSIAVYPAIPTPAVEWPVTALLEGIVASISGRVTSFPPPVEITTARGLTGLWASIVVELSAGTVRRYDLVVLQDVRFLYPVLLQTPVDQREVTLAAFRPLIESIRPVPRVHDTTHKMPDFSWLAE